jgi:hypothetical protein
LLINELKNYGIGHFEVMKKMKLKKKQKKRQIKKRKRRKRNLHGGRNFL